MKRRLLVLALVLFSTLAAGVCAAQEAVRELGQPDFHGFTPNRLDARGLAYPWGVAIDTSRSPNGIWVLDSSNNRVLVVKDGLILGRRVQEGDAVLVVLAAANRDPAANPDPDRFDVLRKDRRLFTFGLGPHACPGETLATTIAQAGVEAMLQVGADLEGFAGNFTYRPSANGRIPLFVWESAR